MQAQNNARGFAEMPKHTVKNVVSTLQQTFFKRPERMDKDDESLLIETLDDYIGNTALINTSKRLSKEKTALQVIADGIAHDLKDYNEKFWEHKILKQLAERKQAHRDNKPVRQRAALKAKSQERPTRCKGGKREEQVRHWLSFSLLSRPRGRRGLTVRI